MAQRRQISQIQAGLASSTGSDRMPCSRSTLATKTHLYAPDIVFFQCLSSSDRTGRRPAVCRPPTIFTSFPFREREQFPSDGWLHRREWRGDIFKAFALGVDA